MMLIGGWGNLSKLVETKGWHVAYSNPNDYKGPVTCEDLFGSADKRSGKFVDILKDAVSGELSKKEGLKLLVIPYHHYPFPAEIAQSLNTLLDDNKVFVTAWNERIHLPADVRVIIQVNGVTNSMPAFYSRLGMVFFEHEE